MKWNDIPLNLKLVLYIVVGVLLVMATTTAVIISTVTTQEEELAYTQSFEMAGRYANQFEADMQSNQAIARTIGASMSEYESADRDEVNNLLRELLVVNPHLLGTYVGYEPNAFDNKDELYVGAEGHDSTGRFVPYWNKIDGPIVIDPLLDYDTLDYYQIPKETEQDVLTEPYYYEGVFIVSYVSPIIKEDEFVGIGGVDVSLDYVDEVVGEVSAFDTGYAFMTGNTGILLSQPDHKEWIGSKTLYDFDVPEISEMADAIKRGERGHIETIDPTTGKNVVMFYEPIKTGNFSFILVIPKEEMFAGVSSLRDRLIVISYISIVFMGGVAYFIAQSVTKPINGIVSGFKKISDNAIMGELDARADVDVQVDFREIPRGLNDILDAVITPIRETIRVTDSLARGELGARVKLDVHGEFKQMADTLDNFAESLDTMIEDSNSVLSALQKDDFTRQVQVKGEGDFRILTDGIEETRLSLDKITKERKLAEEIRKKEIHHRIKNNLQVISSLLFLESEKFTDEKVVDSFRDSQNRVRSMSLVHEKLYQSKDMISIDFDDYITNLTSHLFQSYMVNPSDMSLKLDVEDIFLSMDTAIPLGMIINELISNSLKHAFPEDMEGEIHVNLKLVDDEFELNVSDNGIGFPDDVDFRETESLGLQLVTTLVNQIDGTIEIYRNSGTAFKIRFKE